MVIDPNYLAYSSLPQPSSHPTTARRAGSVSPHDQISALNLPPQLTLGVSLKAPPARGPWRTPRPAQRHHPRPRRRGSPRRRAAERPRDHGHGTRPSPTQTAPGGGRSRDHLVGGGRSASHVPYPHLAGRASWPGGHRGDGGERGGAQQPFYRSNCLTGFSRAQSLPTRPGCIERPGGRGRRAGQSRRALSICSQQPVGSG